MVRRPAVQVVVAVVILLLSLELVASEVQYAKYFKSMSFPHVASGVVATVEHLDTNVQEKVFKL